MIENLKLYAVAGIPILHSKSPVIQNAAFKAVGQHANFCCLAVDSAKEVLEVASKLNINGLCITAPFKEKIIEYLDYTDPKAQIIGGVNTILNKDGKFYGYNTDYIGVVNSLKAVCEELKGKNCLVVGTGGAAKAAVYGLVEAGAKVTVTGRNRMKAANLSSELVCKMGNYTNLEALIDSNDIIVNTIPGKVDVFQSEWFKSDHIIFDANYKDSVLERIASEVFATFINGESWLVHQAVPSFLMFSGKEVEATVMFDALGKVKASEPQNICFSGFLNSGKSSVAQSIAEKLEIQLSDIDALIEKKFGQPIDEFIVENGIQSFDKEEAKFLGDLIEMRTIVSTGSGIVKTKKNREFLRNNFKNIWLHLSSESAIERYESLNADQENMESPDDILMMYLGLIDKYAESATLIIDTDSRDLDQIINKLYEEICSAGIYK